MRGSCSRAGRWSGCWRTRPRIRALRTGCATPGRPWFSLGSDSGCPTTAATAATSSSTGPGSCGTSSPLRSSPWTRNASATRWWAAPSIGAGSARRRPGPTRRGSAVRATTRASAGWRRIRRSAGSRTPSCPRSCAVRIRVSPACCSTSSPTRWSSWPGTRRSTRVSRPPWSASRCGPSCARPGGRRSGTPGRRCRRSAPPSGASPAAGAGVSGTCTGPADPRRSSGRGRRSCRHGCAPPTNASAGNRAGVVSTRASWPAP